MIYTHLAAAIVAGALAFGGAWKVQSWRYTGQIAEIRAAQLEAVNAAITGARTQEQARFKGVQDAQSQAVKRAQVARADSAAARSELDRLRDAIRTRPACVPGDPASTSPERADPGGQLLAECSGAYQDLAATADRLNADRLMLLEGWPR